MTGGSLNTSTRHRNIKLSGGGQISTCEFLVFTLAASDDGAGKQLFVDVLVFILDQVGEFDSFFTGGVSCVTLLPKELSSANEGSRMLEFPPHNIGPLIQFHRQIAMGLDPFSK